MSKLATDCRAFRWGRGEGRRTACRIRLGATLQARARMGCFWPPSLCFGGGDALIHIKPRRADSPELLSASLANQRPTIMEPTCPMPMVTRAFSRAQRGGQAACIHHRGVRRSCSITGASCRRPHGRRRIGGVSHAGGVPTAPGVYVCSTFSTGSTTSGRSALRVRLDRCRPLNGNAQAK
jgi:hypothetical protein